MHNDTYSVHKRGLVLWRAHLLTSEAFCNVYPPPLSDANCLSFPPPGGPGPLTPPASKKPPFPQGQRTPPPDHPLHVVLCFKQARIFGWFQKWNPENNPEKSNKLNIFWGAQIGLKKKFPPSHIYIFVVQRKFILYLINNTTCAWSCGLGLQCRSN